MLTLTMARIGIDRLRDQLFEQSLISARGLQTGFLGKTHLEAMNTNAKSNAK
jgi:hypothetical protein